MAEDNSKRMAFHLNSTTSRNRYVGMPCRSADKATPGRNGFCVSFVDPERPWCYLVQRDGFFYYEPEYAPTNPETFDQETSFVIESGVFFDGYGSLTLLNQPTYYGIAGADGRVHAAEFQDTPEFKDAASIRVISYGKKGDSTHTVSNGYSF